MKQPVVYLNGEFMPLSQASVSVMDRGFLFGDGVYEVIPVFAGQLLRERAHMQRLQNSLQRISLANPCSDTQWHERFVALLEKNTAPGDDHEYAIYLQITRGVYPWRDLATRHDIEPTVFIMPLSVKKVPLAELEKGIRVVVLEDFRWQACDIKSTSLVANVMLKQQAVQQQADDAILVRQGRVTEGTASNLFLVRDDTLVTPPTGYRLLSGITRELVIDLAREHGVEVVERAVPGDELGLADEIWLTSSTREIAPVVELDGRPVGSGKAGPMWRRMVAWYQQNKPV